jgi:hypothetical protein
LFKIFIFTLFRVWPSPLASPSSSSPLWQLCSASPSGICPTTKYFSTISPFFSRKNSTLFSFPSRFRPIQIRSPGMFNNWPKQPNASFWASPVSQGPPAGFRLRDELPSASSTSSSRAARPWGIQRGWELEMDRAGELPQAFRAAWCRMVGILNMIFWDFWRINLLIFDMQNLVRI